jgi:uncharacterized membrane protein
MTRFYWIAAIVLTLAVWGATAALYPRLPEQVPMHWNIRGEIDGYGAKTWAGFLVPAMMLAMLGLFWLLPWLSPRSFDVDRFRETYMWIALLLISLMAYIHSLTLWAAFNPHIDMARALVAGICVCMALVGNVLGKVRRNFWVGIRTPWTLASERVWIDTHRLAARLMTLAGVLGAAISLVAGHVAAFAVSFGLIMTAALAPVVYSLVHYKRLERRGEV